MGIKSEVQACTDEIRGMLSNVNTDEEVKQLTGLLNEIDEAVSEIPDDDGHNPEYP